MKRYHFLFAALFCLLMPSMLLADDVILGPEGDEYITDESIYQVIEQYQPWYKLLGLMKAQTVDTVNVSGVDLGDFPTVCTFVEVFDTTGELVGGLNADSFCVYQDTFLITGFTVEELTLDSCVSSVCLVIDVSGSMAQQSKLAAAKAAANAFVNQMDVYDRVAIVTFSNCYTVVQDFTSNQTVLHNAINSLSANGYTAALDGIWAGVNLTTSEAGSKAVIALSDGMENWSQWCSAPPDGLNDPQGFADDSTLIVNLALGSGIPIYTISLGSSFDPQYLVGLAAGSGGDYYHAPSGSDIDSIYSEVKTRLCSRYLICYESPDTIANGDWHDLIVCRRDSVGNCGPCGTTPWQETDPPMITRTPPTIGLESVCQPTDTDIEICAWVTDLDTPAESLEFSLLYRISYVGSYTQVTMNRTDSTFCYTIPGSALPACGPDSLFYYIWASDHKTTVASPMGAPPEHHGFGICPNQPPVITCPSDIAVACDESTAPANTGTATATDADGPAPTVSYTDSETAGACAQEKTISRRWKAVDSCGDSAICIQTITVQDNVAPVITCPANLTLDCTASTDPSNTGTTTATDNCDPAPVVTYADNQVGNVITRTWTATDACGNSSQCAQTITIDDTTPPTVTCPADVSVQCAGDLPPVNIGAVTATDDCDPSPVVTHTGDVSDGNSCPEVITRTYRATDASGNWAECSQTITIDDTTDPVVTCPADVTISCEESTAPAATGTATATDNCTASPTVTFSDSEVAGACPQEKVITRTWTATDACGNTAQCVQTITVEDNTAPVVTCPADVSVDCAASTDPGNTGNATATDNCTASPTITYADNQVGNVITRTWTATDACGNSDQCAQTITITDTTPPTVDCPADVSVQCVGDLPPVNTGAVTASDDCDPSPVVTHIGDVSDGNSCPEVITRTYRATDASGNWAECTQTITIDDTVDPVITCPASLTVDCTESTDPGNTGSATATDNCTASPTITYADTQVGNVITRTWTAEDDCGNAVTCQQTITIDDTTPPTLTCPVDVSVQCAGDLPPVNVGAVTAADDCDPSPVVTHIGDVSDGNSCPEVITRTYRATDASGNWAECSQTITIDDTIDPVITCPAGLTISCDESTAPANTGTATATDNCSASPAVTFSDSEVAGACPQEKVITRTWTATDDCGNTATCQQVITVEDDDAPTIVCPADQVVDCNESTAPANTGTATATDNCDPAPTVTYADNQIGNVITRTWTATDACGNSDQCAQMITISDSTPPTATCPADAAVQCAADLPPVN
ncbi:MAG: VWA domain-containing protein, partial [bacterium]